jgi:hypothetical protein
VFKLDKLPYPILILVHVILGVMVSAVPFTAKILVVVTMVYLLIRVFQGLDKDNEVLLAAFYFVSVEVFFRMTKSSPVYEIGKYFVLTVVVIGIFLKGFSIKSVPYVFYLLLFIPSIIVTANSIDIDESLRKSIAFNLSGPVVLGVVAIYCYNRRLSMARMLEILGMVVAGILMMTVYITLKTPDIASLELSAASNAALSGGFGPNQVSTALGIGMFCAFVRFILLKSFMNNVIDLSLFLLFTYRGYLTFSRGGVLTAFIMIAVFIIVIILFNRNSFRLSQLPKFLLIGIGVALAFAYTAAVTGGQITNRYTNKNSIGEEKVDVSAGRGDLAAAEYQAFVENPLLGLGAGMAKYYRARLLGNEGASHNEISRLIAEHGSLGILSLILLLLVPLFYRLGDKSNIFFYSFMIFWGATINHSAMRVAAPSFIYGLALLRFEQPTKKLKRKEELEPDEFVEFMREKKLLPKKRVLPDLP